MHPVLFIETNIIPPMRHGDRMHHKRGIAFLQPVRIAHGPGPFLDIRVGQGRGPDLFYRHRGVIYTVLDAARKTLVKGGPLLSGPCAIYSIVKKHDGAFRGDTRVVHMPGPSEMRADRCQQFRL